MSRVGRAPITLPQGVEVQLAGRTVKVRGPKGELTVPINPRISVTVQDGVVTLERATDHRNDRAQHGLARSLVANAVQGVNNGFQKRLEMRGVGFRCHMKGGALELTVGFSHSVVVTPPEGVTIAAPEPTKIVVSGIDKQLVGQVAADIRAVRPPDRYHGKGVRYAGEQVRLKAGKAAAR